MQRRAAARLSLSAKECRQAVAASPLRVLAAVGLRENIISRAPFGHTPNDKGSEMLSLLAAYMPPLRISYEGAAAPSQAVLSRGTHNFTKQFLENNTPPFSRRFQFFGSLQSGGVFAVFRLITVIFVIITLKQSMLRHVRNGSE